LNLDRQPVPLEMKVDDILRFADAAPARSDMLQDLPLRGHLQRLAHSRCQALGSPGSRLRHLSLLPAPITISVELGQVGRKRTRMKPPLTG
jgi:hypothetical protein